MPDTPRITSDYGTGWPRYRTSYARPTPWQRMPLSAPVPLIVWFVLLAAGVMPVSGVWFIVPLVLTPLWFFWRMSARQKQARATCERAGHEPYRPIPEVPEWECWWCGAPLTPSEHVSAQVLDAVREVEAARRPAPQARYSDRR